MEVSRSTRTTCFAALCRYLSLFERWLIQVRMKFLVNSRGISAAEARERDFRNTWKPQYLRSGEDDVAKSDSTMMSVSKIECRHHRQLTVHKNSEELWESPVSRLGRVRGRQKLIEKNIPNEWNIGCPRSGGFGFRIIIFVAASVLERYQYGPCIMRMMRATLSIRASAVKFPDASTSGCLKTGDSDFFQSCEGQSFCSLTVTAIFSGDQSLFWT